MDKQWTDEGPASSPTLSPKRFIMTGLPRTGVTYVSSALSEIKGVRLHGEVLREMTNVNSVPNRGGYCEFRELAGSPKRTLHPRRDRLDYVAMLLTPTEESPVTGLKLLPLDWGWPKRHIYWSPTLVKIARMPKLREFVISNDITVLHFVRDNVLKLFVSSALASRDQSWSSRQPRSNETIWLDPSTIVRKLRWFDRTQQSLSDLCEDFSTVTIHYESPSDLKFQMAASALGVPTATPLTTSLKKQTSDDLSEVIENYETIARVLTGTPFERDL